MVAPSDARAPPATPQLPEKFLRKYKQDVLAAEQEGTPMAMHFRMDLAAQLPRLYLHVW